MRNIRIYTPQHLKEGTAVTLEQAASQHLVQVLRLKPGEDFTLFDGTGRDYPATLLEANRKEAQAALHAPGPAEGLPTLHISLAVAISKGERMDFVIQKATELGVTAIIPLTTRRSVVRLDPVRQKKKLQHWNNVMIAACEQSGRRRLPDLAPIRTLDQVLSDAPTDSLRLILHTQDHQPITSVDPERHHNRIILLVGPEGGLDENEVEHAIKSGFQAIRLGPRILRTETAPLAAISTLQALWGDFRE